MPAGPPALAYFACPARGLKIARACIGGRLSAGSRPPWPASFDPDDKRNALADLFIKAARAAEPNVSAAVIAAAGARALSGPVLLAIVATIQNDHPDIAPHEQWISVGAALQNALLAAEARGFAAKMVSGRRVRAPVLRSAFRLAENEHLVGFVMLGTASTEAASRPALRRSADQVLSDWVPPVL